MAQNAQRKQSNFYLQTEKYFKGLESFYVRILEWVLAHRAFVIISILGIFIASL